MSWRCLRCDEQTPVGQEHTPEQCIENLRNQRTDARDLSQEMLWFIEGMRTPDDDALLEELDARVDATEWLQRTR